MTVTPRPMDTPILNRGWVGPLSGLISRDEFFAVFFILRV